MKRSSEASCSDQNEPLNFEGADDGVKTPDFRYVKGVPEEIVLPTLSCEDTDWICSLDVLDEELTSCQAFLKNHPQSVNDILNDLIARDVEGELPIKEETFLYKRNVAEFDKLRTSIIKNLGAPKSDAQGQQGLDDATRLMVLERRKADWLDENYFPAMYGHVVAEASADVRRFLVRQKNISRLDEFILPEAKKVRLLDELNFEIENPNDTNAMGVYKQGMGEGTGIDIRIPTGFSEKNEWKVYLVALHEFIHSVSFSNYERLGLSPVGADEAAGFNKLNEAITEILAYTVARDRLGSEHQRMLGGQKRDLNLLQMAYSDYTIIINSIFSKVPLDFFVDAMLNEGGMERLDERFKEAFGKEFTLERYAVNLHKLYLPRRSEVATKTGAGGKVFRLSSRK